MIGPEAGVPVGNSDIVEHVVVRLLKCEISWGLTDEKVDERLYDVGEGAFVVHRLLAVLFSQGSLYKVTVRPLLAGTLGFVSRANLRPRC